MCSDPDARGTKVKYVVWVRIVVLSVKAVVLQQAKAMRKTTNLAKLHRPFDLFRPSNRLISLGSLL